MTVIAKTTAHRVAMPESLNESRPVTDHHERSLESAKKANEQFTPEERNPLLDQSSKERPGITFAAQSKLPKLPIPELEDTLKKYLTAVKPLQTAREHAETQQAAAEFLKDEGPELQEILKKYADGKTNYIEQFCGC